MRRVARWMMRGATILSLLVFAAIVVVHVTTPKLGSWECSEVGGEFTAISRLPDIGAQTAAPEYRYEDLGIEISASRVPPPFTRQFGLPAEYVRFVQFPVWPLLLIIALPMIVIYAWRVSVWLDRKRTIAGHCPTCHYDLTGNLSGICPECGTAIAPASS